MTDDAKKQKKVKKIRDGILEDVSEKAVKDELKKTESKQAQAFDDFLDGKI